MKPSLRLVIALATSATGAAAAYLWKRAQPPKPALPRPAIFDPALASAAFGRKIKENDLTVIAGIGPKIAALLQDGGIRSWLDLSSASVARCQEILASRPGFSMHDPATWPEQAKLAVTGKWQPLREWQHQLKHGT